MPSVSGLNREQRGRARDRVVQAALLALDNKDAMDYTDPTVQARIALRWDGIQNRRNSWRQEFPIHSDYSSFATWCLWNALFLHFHLDDFVNDKDWAWGTTFTMLENGRPVEHPRSHACRGDVVLYDAGGGFSSAHCAVIVAREDGNLKAVSHGGDAGPFYVDFDYRPVREVRRYI
jgi:hypothetical protein